MSLLERFKKGKEKELDAAKASSVSVTKKTEKKVDGKVEKDGKDEISKKVSKVVRAETAKVIVAPLITEKAAQLSTLRTYVFEVEKSSTRTQVAVAFKERYGIAPTRVNIVNLRAEPTRFGRTTGKKRAWKKAIITLPKGKSIQIYEGV